MKKWAAAALGLMAVSPVSGQDATPTEARADNPPSGGGAPSSAELAKQLSNPVASLISVPFQTNVDCCYGPLGGARYTLNVQPVIPVSLGSKYNVIIRTIMPLIHEESTFTGQGGSTGLGDVVQSFFFSPKAAKNGFVIGAGPVFLYPTGSSRFGSKKWGAGPTLVMLKQAKGGLTVGILANQIWSFAGNTNRNSVSSMLLQPFLAKSLPDSTTFNLNTETTYNWKAKKWLVPINLGVTHIFRLGKQLVQLGPTARYYVSSPTGGPEWGARFTVTLLFPEGKKK